MENKKIKHIEVYYEDSSMDRICNGERDDKKLTKKQIEWIIEGCLSDLNNFRNRCRDEREATINNYNSFNEDIFSDMEHSHYQMLISLLDDLK